MVENFDIFDFQLGADDLDKIASLDTKSSMFFDHRDPEEVKRMSNAKLNI